MPGLAPFVQTLTANQRIDIKARGTTVFLRQATGTIKVTLRSNQIGERDGVAYTLRMEQAEEWLHAVEFDSVEIEDTSGAANTIELYIGYGRFIKPVPDIVNVQVSSNPNNQAETQVDETNIDVGQAGKAQLLAADPDRVQAWITALAGNAEEIRIGDTNVDTNRGTPLQPGDTILWSSKGPCFACSIATVNQGAAVTAFTE